MTAFLSVACRCGRSASAPCPSLSDLPAAQETLVGWGYDERGFVRCAECLTTGEDVPAPQRVARQAELFAGAAA